MTIILFKLLAKLSSIDFNKCNFALCSGDSKSSFGINETLQEGHLKLQLVVGSMLANAGRANMMGRCRQRER